MLRKRAFLGLLLFALVAVHRPRRADLRRPRTIPQVAMLAPTRRDVPPVPRAAGLLRLLHHDLRRRRADRQRPPRQRAADLPVEAADAHRSTSPASRRCCSRSCCSSRSCRRCCCCCCRCCSPAASRSCKNNLFLFPAITVGALLQALLATFTMLALSSLSKSSALRRHPLRRHHLLHRGDLRRDATRSPAAPRCRGSRSART